MSGPEHGPDTVAMAEELRATVLPPRRRPGRRGQAIAADAAAAAAGGIPVRSDYELETRREPPPVPNGWYSILSSAELPPAEVRSVIAVARELVVFRGDSGQAQVMDAHCPHLGAHLGGGLVQGDTLECPYHGWRYDHDGRCVEIPYSDAKIPERACVRTYPTVEQDGFVFFWYHAGDRPPAYELPRVTEVDDPDWSDAHPWKGELVAALQEMAENNVDYAHLRYVHGRATVPDDTSVFTTDGWFSKVVETLPDGTEFYRTTHGPGVAVLTVPGVMVVLTTTTPIDRRHCRLNWHFHVPRHMEPMVDDLIAGVTGEYGLLADIPIWRDKVFLERPLLVKADGNIAEFRRWYQRFYGSD